MIRQARVEHVKVWHSKAQLVVACQIDEVNLCLEGRFATKGQTNDTAQDGEVRRLDGIVVGAYDIILDGAGLLLVDEDCHFAILHSQRTAISDTILTCC